MVLYTVTWSHCTDLAKGKGRAKKNEHYIVITVLCRNNRDAIQCLDYHFRHRFLHDDKVSLDDGEVTLKRSIIDSRGFNAHYLLMDGLREPIDLVDLKSNILRFNSIFGGYRSL